ncbi:MAG: two-component system sensor histidine kinase NtrB [Planctomycetota bacterium]|jgi:signal transduction histidine kinase
MSEDQPSILIIEDDEGIAHLARKYLEKAGFNTTIALNGAAAIKSINDNNFDLMVLDFALPDMMADELLDDLESSGSDIPFIITTGRGCSNIARELLDKGARDFIVKNDDFWNILTDSVRKAVTTGSRSEQTFSNEDRKKMLKIKNLKHFEDKMNSLNRLSFTVGHDLNNMLSGILGYAELIELSSEENSKTLKYNKSIYESAQRARNLSEQLLHFSKIKNSEFSELHIHEVIDSTVENTELKFGSNNIKCEYNSTADTVYASRVLLEEVIKELLINAEESLQKEMEITISTTEEVLDSDFLPAVLRNEIVGRFVKITFRDSGCGIKSSDYKRIFEPYVTGKDVKGSGLGLTNVFNFMKYHKGAIDLLSKPGSGSCFYIYLPLK